MIKKLERTCIYKARSWIMSWAILCATTGTLSARSCPTPPLEVKPIIIGFAGWTLPLTSYRGSAVEQIIDRLRAGGASAEIYPPDDWPAVAGQLTNREDANRPIILLGFSMGAAAAIHVAQKLGAVGVPVRNIVMVEAWNPEPIPANVAAATHFYSTRFAGLIRPGPGNEGLVENIDLNGQIPGIEAASHIAMSQMALVQDLVIDKSGFRDEKDRAGPTVAARSRSSCRDAATAPRLKARPAPKR